MASVANADGPLSMLLRQLAILRGPRPLNIGKAGDHVMSDVDPTPIHCDHLFQKRACLRSSPKRNESLSAHREKPRLQVKAEHLPFIFREVGAMAKRLTIHGESILQSA